MEAGKIKLVERILTYPITKEYDGLSIKEFLKKQNYSDQLIIALKKMEQSILVNDVWCYVNHILCNHDQLVIKIKEQGLSEKISPVSLPLSIVYEDDDLLVLNKAANMPIHPSMKHSHSTLANAVMYYYLSKGCPFTFRCVNRLDKDTSGLTIIAKNMLSASILSTQVANKALTREYLAIVNGIPTTLDGTIDAPIARVSDSIIEREVNQNTGETAITHYHTLKTYTSLALLSLTLETGRTHQIRVHLKHMNHPIIGDFLYNPDFTYIQRQALHSYRLSFSHPITHEPLTFIAPLPSDMQSILDSFNT